MQKRIPINKILLTGALLGLLSVIMGAYIDHSLVQHLTGKPLHSILSAARYHQFYALVICVIGLAAPLQPLKKARFLLSCTGLLFTVGTLLFSFSIYLAILLDKPILMRFAPFGGLMLMAAWCSLTLVSFLSISN